MNSAAAPPAASRRWSPLTTVAVGGALTLALLLTRTYSYLLFHTLAELFGIVIAGGVFMLAWVSRKLRRDDFLLFLGCAFLCLGFLDLIHTLSYSGMGVIMGFTTNLPTQLWIGSRYFQALALLLAPLALGRQLRFGWVAGGMVSVCALILLSIFAWDIFPDCFREDSGLTPFKEASEYVISGILVAAILHFRRRRAAFEPLVYRYLIGALAASIGAELLFTLYTGPYQTVNMAGHLLKVFAFFLFFKAVIESGVQRPLQALFQDLSRESEALRRERDQIRSILTTMQDGVCIIDAQRMIDYANPALERIFGPGRGRTCHDYLHGSETPCPDCCHHDILSGETVHWATTAPLRGRHFDVLETPFRLANGQVGKLNIMRDVTERRLAEEQLADLARFPEENPSPVIRVGTDGTVLYSNPPGRHLLTNPEAAPAAWLETIAACDSDGDTRAREITDSRGRCYVLRFVPFRERGYLNIYGIDITGQRAAQDLAQEREEHYHRLYAAMTEGVALHEMVCDQQGQAVDYRILEVNQAFEDILQLPRSEVVGKLATAAYHQPEPPYLDYYRQVVASGSPVRFETYFPSMDKWFQISAFRPRPGQFATVFSDISRRKQSETTMREHRDALAQTVQERTTQLRQRDEILERIFSTTHLLLAYLDPDFNFLRVNEAYARADGRPPEFFAGRNHFALYPHAENERLFRQVVREGRPHSVYAKPFANPNDPSGRTSYWDWTLHPVRNEQGGVEGLLLCMIDMTERKQAEDRLDEANRQLAAAQRLADIGTLGATVAHELRNPLGVMRLSVFNLRRKFSDPLLTRHLDTLERKITESDRIITNLLLYTRINPPQYQSFAIAGLLAECCDIARQRFAGGQYTLTADWQSLRDLAIMGDPDQLREVFTNLINNAIQALAGGPGQIVVKGNAAPAGTVTITVSDTGPGIDPADLGKVFEPLFSRKSKGTGLGLTIVRELVNLHNGAVTVASAPGQGTTFTVCLPQKAGDRSCAKS